MKMKLKKKVRKKTKEKGFDFCGTHQKTTDQMK